jgi:hypothetical protein
MTTIPLVDVEAEADRLIDACENAGLIVRLLGGLGVVQHRHGMVPASLSRSFGDIDVVVQRGDDKGLRRLLEELGYDANRRFNSLHGDRRLIFIDAKNKRRLDVFVGDFAMCHSLGLNDRLASHPRALSAADLLLTKLQVVEINRKDLLDAAVLLLAHDVGAPGADGCCMDVGRITDVTSSDWGWFTTFSANLSRIGPAASEVVEGDGAAVIDSRAVAIGAAIEGAPKSVRWRMRSRIGRRVPWYQLPEEVAGG